MKPKLKVGDYVKWIGMSKEGKVKQHGLITEIYEDVMWGKPCYRYKVKNPITKIRYDCSEGLLRKIESIK